MNCPMCSADNAPIGALGLVAHFTCRMCGWWYAVTLTPQTAADWMQDDDATLDD